MCDVWLGEESGWLFELMHVFRRSLCRVLCVSHMQPYECITHAFNSCCTYCRRMCVCRTALPEAFAALLELPPDTVWDRLVRDTGPGSLLAALSGGLGPSPHRSAVQLLSQMPRSSRGTLLRQLGAVQLLAKQLNPKGKQQVRDGFVCWGVLFKCW